MITLKNIYRTLCVIGAVAMVGCVDESYRISDVSTEVTLGTGTTTLPIGYLETMTLQDLLGEEEIEGLVQNADGTLAYSYDGGTQVVLKNTTKDAKYMNASALAPSSNKYTSPSAEYIWQLQKQDDGSYYMYNSSVNKFLYATTSALQLLTHKMSFTVDTFSPNEAGNFL